MSSINMKNIKFYFASTSFIYTLFALIKRHYFTTDRVIEPKLITRGGGVLQDRIKEGRPGFCWEKLDETNGLKYLGPEGKIIFNLLHPTGHVMHQKFNIQQLYGLPTLYLCVLYLSENKQRLVPLTA